MDLTEPEKRQLLDAAYGSIEYGLTHGHEQVVSALDYPEPLRATQASFVTLRQAGELLGCIGTTRAIRPLITDVVHNAFHAAFSDPRFPPLAAEQLPGLDVHISVLSPLEPLACTSEEDLLRQLRPGIDGLLIEDGELRATFLPAMWAQLPDPRQFLRLLKEKACLPAGHWSPTFKAFRYTADSVP